MAKLKNDAVAPGPGPDLVQPADAEDTYRHIIDLLLELSASMDSLGVRARYPIPGELVRLVRDSLIFFQKNPVGSFQQRDPKAVAKAEIRSNLERLKRVKADLVAKQAEQKALRDYSLDGQIEARLRETDAAIARQERELAAL